MERVETYYSPIGVQRPGRKLGLRRGHGGRLIRTRQKRRVLLRVVTFYRKPRMFMGNPDAPWYVSQVGDPTEFDLR